MLRRALAALLAAGALIAGMLVPTTPAAAADGVWCNADGQCYVQLTYRPSDPSPSPDSNGWTAGAPRCYMITSESQAIAQGYDPDEIFVYSESGGYTEWYVLVNCGSGISYWSNNRQCYVSMAPGEWPARPPQYDQDAGYYVCTSGVLGPGGGVDIDDTYFWSNTVPPGLQVLTPGNAAAQLISTFQLRGVTIGMAPRVNPEWGHRRTYVGIPVWLWVDDPEPLTWGPYTETATLGGQTITATAKVSAIRWEMGDGGTEVCGSTGTPYTYRTEITASPTCGYTYTRTSSSSPADRFTVTAVSQWVVTWTSLSGANGTVNLTTSSSVDLEVNELQSVTVPNPNG